MDSKFFNGFLVLLSPDSIFKRTIKEESAVKPLISLFISCMFFTIVALYLIKKAAKPAVEIIMVQELMFILCAFFSCVLITAAISGFFNWVYSLMIKKGTEVLEPDFLSSFCCHAYVIPLWMFLLFVHIFFSIWYKNIIVIICVMIFIIRLLDIEARLLKTMYKLRLIQGYVIIFIQMLLLSLGAGIGFLISWASRLGN